MNMFAAIFLHATPESGARKLMSAPESIEAGSINEAKAEGLQILRELASEHRSLIKPISIVELSDDMLNGIAGCERVFLPMGGEDEDSELEFADVTGTLYWQNQPWWSR